MTRLPDLGPRGEGWVVLQFALIVVIVATAAVGEPWDEGIAAPLRAVGTLAIAAGVLLLGIAIRTLGDALTAFPRPLETGTLRTDGVYGLARHPIYGGVMLIAIGWALLRGPLALIPVAALVVLFALKSVREEAFLVDHYPGYPAYRDRVRRRFIPGLI